MAHVPQSVCAWIESQFFDLEPERRRHHVRIFCELARRLRDVRGKHREFTMAAEKKKADDAKKKAEQQ